MQWKKKKQKQMGVQYTFKDDLQESIQGTVSSWIIYISEKHFSDYFVREYFSSNNRNIPSENLSD